MNRLMFSDAAILLTILVCGCAATPAAPGASSPGQLPPPSSVKPRLQEGAWRASGSTGAMFSDREIDDVDQTTFGLGANAGKMIAPNLLVEGELEYMSNETDFGAVDVEESDLLLGGGVRYYLTASGNTVPYLRGMVGLLCVDLDFGGFDDDDTSPYLGGGAGAETFLTDNIALDYGFRFIYAFDVFDESFTDLGLYLGVSVWL